jgi:uncharacterized protein YjiS (DUF1127 family)
MTDTALTASPSIRAARLRSIGQLAMMLVTIVREWRRRVRSRAELASYSFAERSDLGYAAELDGEIQKPFWRK